MGSYVTAIPAASSDIAAKHFAQRLTVETDCADVADAMRRDLQDFVLLHVVGTKESYGKRHVPGAVHLPHREITAERMAEWSPETLFVTYCAGPHCNGADQAALKIARLDRPVKIMIGGITGWADEGLHLRPVSSQAISMPRRQNSALHVLSDRYYSRPLLAHLTHSLPDRMSAAGGS